MSKIQNLFSSNFFQLAILLVIAFVIKGLYIGVMDIGMDECFSVYTAQLSPSQIISWLSTGDNPPLWELLLHYWIKLFGISELSIRIPSYLFNVLTIIPIYFLGEKFIVKRIGLTASILFTLSSLSLFMAHEARVYSLLGFLSMYSVYLFVSSIKEKNQIRSLVFLTLVNGLILYTHYLGYWIILVQIICFLSIKSIRQVLLKKYLIHLGVLLLLFLPILPVLYDRILNSGLNGTWISTVTGLEDLYNMIWKFSNKPITTVIFLAFILVGLALRIIHRKKNYNQNIFLIHLFLWIPLLGSFLLSFKVGFFLDRYFYFLSPLFYLVVATSIWRTFYFNKKTRISVAIISLVLMGITFKPHTQESKISGYHKNNKKLVSKIKE